MDISEVVGAYTETAQLREAQRTVSTIAANTIFGQVFSRDAITATRGGFRVTADAESAYATDGLSREPALLTSWPIWANAHLNPIVSIESIMTVIIAPKIVAGRQGKNNREINELMPC